jgi:hypothetical protein
MLKYAVSAEVSRFPALRKLTSELKRDYSPKGQPDVKIPLTPLFFWHDKPHIACTEHYLARVFPSRLAMLRGDFIEDKIGQRARTQMKEGLVSNVPIFSSLFAQRICGSCLYSKSLTAYCSSQSGQLGYTTRMKEKRCAQSISTEGPIKEQRRRLRRSQ